MNDPGKEAKNSSGVRLGSPRPALARRIFIGRLACGCAVAASIDPDDVGEMARNGYFIETVDTESSVQIAGCQCPNVS